MIDGPVTNRRISRRLVRQLSLLGVGLLFVAVIAGSGYWLYQGQVRSENAAADVVAEQMAKDIAQQVAEPFAALRAQLIELGVSAEAMAAFEAGDVAALEALAQRHTADFRAALKLRLLQPGNVELQPEARPPLSFASLAMLRQVEESTAPASAEMHLFGTPGQHIVLAAPALDSAGQLRGLLHLSLDAELAQQVMDGITIESGRVELRQAAGAKMVVLGAIGAPAAAGKPTIVSVSDTRWSIALFPGEGAMAAALAPAAGGMGMGLLLGVLGLLVAGAAGVWILLRRRAGAGSSGSQNAGTGENIIYAGAVKAIMEGIHPGVEKLVPNLPGLGQSRRITTVSRGLAGSDITMIAPKRELQAQSDNSSPTPVPAAKPVPKPPPRPASRPVAAKTPAPAVAPATAPIPPPAAESRISRGIFRTYDIRGIVDQTLTPEVVASIGQAIGTEAGVRKQQTVVVGRDGRLSSPEFAEALIKGLRAAGRNVVDIGMVPTPVLYYATHELGVHSGVMVTGSHNGPEYNGLKIVLGDETLSEDAIQGLYQRIVDGDLESGRGELEGADVVAAYIRRISEDIPVALGGAFRIVIDCGNGVAGAVVPQLIRALGHDVIEMNCEVDGRFPIHHPDPSQPENMQALIEKVRAEDADIGLAFDGDGDRLGVVDGTGRIVWPDQQLLILAQDVLTRNPGAPIIFDVKCSRHLGAAIEAAGGRALMWRTGHSLIKRKMKETDAPLAGEMSGHIFFKERWYGFDDALYTAARLLEVLMRAKRKPAEVFAELPQSVTTPELRVPLREEDHAACMQALRHKLPAGGAVRVIDIDGLRVEYPDGWGLVRPSNTSPALVVRFEADNEPALARIKAAFRGMLLGARPDLALPF